MKIKRKIETKQGLGGNITLLLILIALLNIYTLPLKAQCKLDNSAITSGENIEYTLYFYWGLIWKEAGSAVYTTSKTTYNNLEALKLNLTMSTNETADNFFKMRDTITSIVSNNLEPLYYRKAAEEGKRYTIDEATYNYINNKSIASLKRSWKDGEVQCFQEERSNCIYDMLSVLCKAKALDNDKYKKGDRFNIEMTTGKKVETLTMEYRGVENVRAEDKTNYKCMVYTLLKPNKKNKLKDFITFYISNDTDKVLVKLKLELNFGTAQVTLKKVNH